MDNISKTHKLSKWQRKNCIREIFYSGQLTLGKYLTYSEVGEIIIDND